MCNTTSGSFVYSCRFCNLETRATRIYHNGEPVGNPYEDYAAYQACSSCYHTIELALPERGASKVKTVFIEKTDPGRFNLIGMSSPKINGGEIHFVNTPSGEFFVCNAEVLVRNLPEKLVSYLKYMTPYSENVYSDATLTNKLKERCFYGLNFHTDQTTVKNAVQESVAELMDQGNDYKNMARVAVLLELDDRLKESVS